MGRTGVVERRSERGGDSARRLKPAAGPLVELLWAVGLVVSLGVVSVAVWALLNTIGRI